MPVLLAHIEGRQPIMHSLIGTEGKAKIFAIQISLADTKAEPAVPWAEVEGVWGAWRSGDVRSLWMRREPGVPRKAMKYFFRLAAGNMVRSIEENLSIPACAAYAPPYSVTVYGLTGLVPEGRAQKAATITLESQGWEETQGGIWRHANRNNGDDPEGGFPCLEAQIFPDRIRHPIEMGNALPLPLGADFRAPKDKSFFLDLRFGLNELIPRDITDALTASSQFAGEIPQELAEKYGYVHKVTLTRTPEGS